jgi:succinoglycan biosynthesis transport protein ExoP
MTGVPDERLGAGRYLQALRQHWPFVVLSAAIAVAAAVAYSAAAQKRYEAGADVLVNPIPAGTGSLVGIPLIAESATSRSVLTAAHLVKSPEVAADVKRTLHSRQGINGLLDRIDVKPQQQSAILTITATASSPEAAARLANAFADALIAQRTALFRNEVRATIRRLEARLRALGQSSTSPEATALASRLGDLRGLSGGGDPTLQVASRAVPPTLADWPRPVLSVLVALAAGLLLGVGVAVALELLNPLVLRDEDVRLPILAKIPVGSLRSRKAGASAGERMPEDAREAYRRARFALSATDPNRALPHAILVTSVADGDDSATVAIGLALTTAAAGSRVALVDANLRRPRLGTALGVTSVGPGVEAVLAGEVDAADALIATAADPNRLTLLPATPHRDPPVDLLQTPGLRGLMEELDADVIVIDSPPAIDFADAFVIAGDVGAVVVAVRLGRTRRDKLVELRRLFAQRGVVPAGAIVLPRRRLWERRLHDLDTRTEIGADVSTSARDEFTGARARDGGESTRDRAGSGRR